MLRVCARHIIRRGTASPWLSLNLAREDCGPSTTAAVQRFSTQRSSEGHWPVLSGLSPATSSFLRVSEHIRFTSGVAQDTAVQTISDRDFNQFIDRTLETLYTELEALLEEHDIPNADIELSDGVIKLALGEHGTYVLNKQAPNKQLWMSSPVSGPVRYDCHDGRWIYARDGHDLQERLNTELGRVFGPVDLALTLY